MLVTGVADGAGELQRRVAVVAAPAVVSQRKRGGCERGKDGDAAKA